VESIDIELKKGNAVVTLGVDAAGMRGGNPFSGIFRKIRVFLKDSTSEHG